MTNIVQFPGNRCEREIDIKQDVKDLFGLLTPDEAKAIRLLYGIDCDRLSRAEASKIFDKDIDELEARALRNMRLKRRANYRQGERDNG